MCLYTESVLTGVVCCCDWQVAMNCRLRCRRRHHWAAVTVAATVKAVAVWVLSVRLHPARPYHRTSLGLTWHTTTASGPTHTRPATNRPSSRLRSVSNQLLTWTFSSYDTIRLKSLTWTKKLSVVNG